MADGKNGESRGRGRLWPLFVGLPLIAVLAVAAVVFAGSGDRAPRDAGQERQASGGGNEQASGGESGATSETERLGHPALGDAGAPVVIVEYGDFQ